MSAAGQDAAAGGDSAAVAALQAALAAEQEASYGYGIVGAHLAGARFARASADCLAHERARDDLEQMIVARGARPAPAAAAYRLPVAVHTSEQAIALAVLLERQAAAAYLGMIALADRALREFGARGLTQAAVRQARWSGRSQPFPGLGAAAPRTAGR